MPKSRRLSDATLVRRSQQGDRRAFGALVNRYDRRLRGLAFALLLDRAQMDAALSMAYLRAWRDVVRVQPRDDVGPWLYRAVYNACIDQLRRAEPPRADGDTAGLYGALARLAPADRVAVVLVEREGFTPASAARILGVGVDVIEERLDLARDELRPFVPEPAPPTADEVGEGSGPADEPGADEVAVAGSDPGDPAEAIVDAGAIAGAEGEAAPDPEGAAAGASGEGSADPLPDAVPADDDVPADVPAGTAIADDGHGDDDREPAAADARADVGPAPQEPEGADDGHTDDADADADAAAPVAASAGASPSAPDDADRSTVPAEAPPDPDVEGVRVLEPVGAANESGNGSADQPGNGSGNGEAPPLPEGDAHIEHTPADLSEEIVLAEEDAAAGVRQVQ